MLLWHSSLVPASSQLTIFQSNSRKFLFLVRQWILFDDEATWIFQIFLLKLETEAFSTHILGRNAEIEARWRIPWMCIEMFLFQISMFHLMPEKTHHQTDLARTAGGVFLHQQQTLECILIARPNCISSSGSTLMYLPTSPLGFGRVSSPPWASVTWRRRRKSSQHKKLHKALSVLKLSTQAAMIVRMRETLKLRMLLACVCVAKNFSMWIYSSDGVMRRVTHKLHIFVDFFLQLFMCPLCLESKRTVCVQGCKSCWKLQEVFEASSTTPDDFLENAISHIILEKKSFSSKTCLEDSI